MGKALALAKFTKPIIVFSKRTMKLLSKNSNLLLTILSAVGAVSTAALAVHGTIKAVKICEEKQVTGTKEVVKTVWKCYIPTLGMLFLTVTSIVCNGKINAKKIAVLASALGSTRETLKITEEKMSEMLGPKKAQAVIDEVHSTNAENNKPKTADEIIDTGNGNELFFLEDCGQWLKTDVNHIELAELKTARDLDDANDWDENGDAFIMANDALAHLGARTCNWGATHGWVDADLRKLGLKGPKFRISSKRMDINGENRAVGTIWFEPEPDPI